MAKRRGAGEGSIYKSDGRWVGKVDLGKDASGRRLRKKVTRRTRADVLDAMREIRREHEQGKPLGRANDTVSKLLGDYLARGLPATVRTAKTRESYRWAIEDHIVPALGARKLTELSPDDVDGFLVAKVSEGFSRATLVHFHGVLTRALRWGEQRGRVARNVSKLCDTPQARKDRRESKALTVEQARALLAAAEGERLEALIVLGLMVPSRPGELTGLCWDAIDFERGIVHFRRALHYVSGSLVLGELKTPQSRRSVEVPALVMAALKRRKTAQSAERLKADYWRDADNLVFTSPEGAPIDPANLRRKLRQMTRKAEIPGQWTVYELRHSAVSIMSAQGVHIEQIADAAGHKDATVTARVYRHQLEPVISSAKIAMDAAFREKSSG